MSRRLLLGLVGATLLVTSPESSSAQRTGSAVEEFSQTPEAAALLARLDSLRPLLREARADLDARERKDKEATRQAVAAVARVDTLRVGLVTVITPVEQTDLARELFTEVWDEHFSLIESSLSLEEARFAFHWAAQRVPIHIDENGRDLRMTRLTRRPRVKAAIRAEIGLALAADLIRVDSRIEEWASANPFQRHEMEVVYRLLASKSSIVTRDCMAGNVEACSSAMGLGIRLVEPEDQQRPWPVAHIDQVRAWYTPDERRSLVARESRFFLRQFRPETRRQCVEHSNIGACDRLLQEAYLDWTPLSGIVRATLLAYAIEQGGAGAWERLAASPELDPIEALEVTSAMSAHDLLTGWRAELMTFQPNPYSGLVPKSGLAVVWTLFFGALAMRSTRWRSA